MQQTNEYGYVNQPGNRYFWKIGAKTRFNSGFKNKQQCKDWLREQFNNRGLDWTNGFQVKFKDTSDIWELVSRNGEEVKYF